MNTHFFINLLLEVQEFENSGRSKNDSTIEDFRNFLNDKFYKSQSPRFISESEQKKVNDLENEIAKQVILLSRFTKQMVRRGLQDFPELYNEEFTYLYRIMDEPLLTKMQLVEKNAHEKQTGMEIIRRLVKNNLLEEIPDSKDKRVTRLKISELGKKYFDQSVESVSITSRVLSAKLDIEEKNNLLKTLKKLNEFHFNVYHQYKDSDISEINNLI
ncbi:MarR family transcriptional regulator [Chryseobacterium taklimakanense]|uniref:MarR family winged helix-turn-helix transcriptional regulator n=1 Tax=Chryseobacterium taklimakanense TaxID=536441 RepID=UPI001EF46F00|nr:MarR family transcriptional regulator [Chryseobacterium taklimakanense]MCG7280516.1 MarR family transcriptional regulator [Chryseobacterium taklimakanense]